MANPAIEKLLATFTTELVFAEVFIRRTGERFELRHLADRELSSEQLRGVPLPDLRALAQKTAAGQFRPLKSAPNLQRGWRSVVSGAVEIEMALSHLYPGAVADWFATETGPPPITDFRAFIERQTGMYRVTTKLSDAAVADVIRACCAKQFCLKRRLWTVADLETDASDAKSIIPCLEPCAVLLEFARMAVRLEQAEKHQISDENMPVSESVTRPGVEHGDLSVREADFSSPANPRRVQLRREKLRKSNEAGGAEG
jgi:hypothetical protein